MSTTKPVRGDVALLTVPFVYVSPSARLLHIAEVWIPLAKIGRDLNVFKIGSFVVGFDRQQDAMSFCLNEIPVLVGEKRGEENEGSSALDWDGEPNPGRVE